MTRNLNDTENILRQLEESEKALFHYANELGYWPDVMDWNRYASQHDYFSNSTLQMFSRKSWEAYRKESGLEQPIYITIGGERVARKKKSPLLVVPEQPSETDMEIGEELTEELELAKKIKDLSFREIYELLKKQRRVTHHAKDCIASLKTASETLGKSFYRQDYDNWRKGTEYPPSTTICHRLGTWEEAMKQAELIPMKLSVTMESIEETLEALKSYVREHKVWPTIDEWDLYAQSKGHHGYLALRRFLNKSWKQIKEGLGIRLVKPKKERNKMTESECIEMLQKASETLGKTFSYQAFKEWFRDQNDYKAGITVPVQYGWKTIMKKAGLFSVTGEEFVKESLKHLLAFGKEFGFPTMKEWDEYAKKKNLSSSARIQAYTKEGWKELQQKHHLPPKLTQDDQLKIKSFRALRRYGSTHVWPTRSKWNQYAKKRGYVSASILVSFTNKSWQELKSTYSKVNEWEHSIQKLEEYVSTNGWPTTKEWDHYAKQHNLHSSLSLCNHQEKTWTELREELGAKDKQAYSLEALIHYAKEKDVWPSLSEWTDYAKEHQLFGPSSIIHYTNKKWTELRDEHGFQDKTPNSRPKGTFFTEEECIHALKDAAKQTLDYTIPVRKYDEWRKGQKDYPTSSTISKKFGSWNEAKRRAGLLPNDSLEKTS